MPRSKKNVVLKKTTIFSKKHNFCWNAITHPSNGQLLKTSAPQMAQTYGELNLSAPLRGKLRGFNRYFLACFQNGVFGVNCIRNKKRFLEKKGVFRIKMVFPENTFQLSYCITKLRSVFQKTLFKNVMRITKLKSVFWKTAFF